MAWWHDTIHFLTHFWTISKDFFMHLIVWLNHYAQLHPDQLIWIAAVCAFIEALPVLGTIFPGSVTMTFIGILAGRGLVGVGETLMFTTFGAFAGDCIGYFLGRVFHEKIPRCWPFKKRPHWLAYGRQFFEKHGGKSVVIGRFIGPLRSTVPLVAGLLQMKVGRFIVAGLFSAFLWAVAYLLPGLLIGAASLAMTPKATALFLGAGVLIVVLLWLLFWLADRLFSYTHQRTRLFFIWLSGCCARNKPCAAVLQFLSKPGELVDYRALERLAWAVFFFVLFLIVMLSVIMHGALFRLNEPAFHLLMNLRYPSLHSFFVVLTFFGSHYVWFSTIIVMSFFFLLTKDWRRLLFFLLGSFAVVAAVHFFKIVIAEPRPTGLVYLITSHSFPSGHTTVASVVYGLLAFWATETMPVAWRGIVRAVVLVFLALIGFSRLYLGVHWLFDVLAGFCLAASIFLVITLLIRRTAIPAMRYPRAMRWAALAAVMVPCLVVSLVSFKAQLSATALKWPITHYTFQQWRQHSHQSAQLHLSNRRGKPMLPFNIQWLGDIQCISQQLKKMGWQVVPDRLTMPSIIRRMTLKSASDHPRLLPLRFRGNPPVLRLYHTLAKKGEVLSLRLWGSGMVIEPGNEQIWVGTIARLTPKKKIYDFGTIHRIHFDSGKVVLQFSASLPSFYHIVRIQQRSSKVLIRKFLDWNNNVILIYPFSYDKLGPASMHVCPLGGKKQ